MLFLSCLDIFCHQDNLLKKKHNADCNKVNTYISHNYNEVISKVSTTRISGVFNICFLVCQYSQQGEKMSKIMHAQMVIYRG